MNALLDPFRQLVARRLWPVAALLLLAAVATPFLLGDHEEAPVVTASATGPGGDEPFAGQPIVSVAGEDTRERRRVLGARKDPFKPSGRQLRPARTSSDPVSADRTSARSGSGSGAGLGSGSAFAGPAFDAAASAGSSLGGGTGGGGGGGASAPAPGASLGTPSPLAGPVAPVAPKPSFAVYSLSVAFDDQRRTLARLDALPDADDPAVIYLGLLEDGKTAVFLLDASVTAEGDGACHPSPSDCQRLYLKKGETEFLDVEPDEGGEPAQHQLDLLAIHTKRTTAAGRAAKARAAVSSAGRRALRARMSRVGRLRYDARTGRLHAISLRTWRARR